MIYMQSIESRLNETLEDPDLRSGRNYPEVPHQGFITARLRLIAPPQVVQTWEQLIHAWDVLAWNAEQDGPVNDRGDYHLKPSDADVVRARAALQALTTALRSAMDVSNQ
jgi:hypothetical protein